MSAEPWRYRCPDGHCDWSTRFACAPYYCRVCETGFETLRDMKAEP